MNLLLAQTDAAMAGQGAASMISLVVMVVFWFGIMYFLMIRPQRKEQKKKAALVNSVEVGDSILTTSGFYGIVIDVTDEDVIVEFGNNKNCRIPMKKAAIEQVEKPDSE
ncbi:MAG: preprotein translocase subunit YajC [Lachnospiraceae bacterium]|jgi:preprotein translocase subunit YajC|nr:preprotein translocase subunit YajC [Lachnospiraceae bacterium]MCI8966915.1 preprotein translocase subunit YajC [Lachnospiraceae bacterium]MDE6919248.1 preprotein translocase subunit YajC [Lachnospiraceae bacterium]MDE6991710.1 preprotein translocase subunit YajC [Lachnospiraceae bacterium]MDE7002479.1 preprotein translocase subunit YajC [Lachnospiraceae bacterium]